jgi:hypothetical protein
MNKGLKDTPTKPVDFGTTNFKMDWDDSTDNPDYDKNYNKEQREPAKSKFGQDSHVRGRDPIGKNQFHTALKNKKRKVKMNPIASISRESLNSMLNQIKTKELIHESLKNGETEENIKEDDGKNYLNEDNLLDLDKE